RGAFELGHANADRLRAVAGEPGVPSLRVRQDQRERPRQERPDGRRELVAQLGDRLEQELDVAGEEGGWLTLLPDLEPGDLAGRRLAGGVRAEAVDGVGREHDRLPGPDRGDGPLDHAALATPRKDTNASPKASGSQ